MEATAFEMPPGRPRRYGEEETKPLSLRLPLSIMGYLGPDNTARRESAVQSIFFEKDLSAELGHALKELRYSAADAGQSYELDRAKVIARLVRRGLEVEGYTLPPPESAPEPLAAAEAPTRSKPKKK